MARNISRNPNQILRRKPNQFPTSRLEEINWGRKCSVTNEDSNGDQEEPGGSVDDSTTDSTSKLEYLRNRFNQPTCACPTGPKGET